MGLSIVLLIRLTIPLTILRWPLAGGLLAIVADTVDILIFDVAGFPGFASYQEIDKALDIYYLAFEFLVAQRWLRFERFTASSLFGYRMVGIALFEITGARPLLLLFPNLFEMYFLFILVVRRYYPAAQINFRRTLGWLAILLIPKLCQEYLLHDARILDDLVATDVIGDVFDRLHR